MWAAACRILNKVREKGIVRATRQRANDGERTVYVRCLHSACMEATDHTHTIFRATTNTCGSIRIFLYVTSNTVALSKKNGFVDPVRSKREKYHKNCPQTVQPEALALARDNLLRLLEMWQALQKRKAAKWNALPWDLCHACGTNGEMAQGEESVRKHQR